MKKPRLTTPELEMIIADHFDVRRNLIVPNIHWGFGLRYEADLVVVTKARFAYEVELKISKADLKKDKDKKHLHNAKCFKRFYYAMPEDIYDPELIPVDGAGILLCKHHSWSHWKSKKMMTKWSVKEVVAPVDRKATKLTIKQYLKLLHLSAMRVWSMKKKFVRSKQNGFN